MFLFLNVRFWPEAANTKKIFPNPVIQILKQYIKGKELLGYGAGINL